MSYRLSSLMPQRAMAVVAISCVSVLLALLGGLFAARSAQASTLPTVSIAVTKSSVTIGGALESGGVNVVSTGTGTKEANVILFLLKPGVSVAEVEALIKAKKTKDPNNTAKLGSIVFDTEAAAGKGTEVQTYFQPGQYLLLIGEGEGEAKLRTTFTVTASKAPVALPAPQATIRSIEFGFRGPSTLHDGELVRYENEGYLVHMDFLAPVKSHKAAKQVVKDLLSGHEKAIEKLIIGQPFGAGPLSHEAFQQETVTAKPGWYVEVCFMETQDGRPHTRLGMERVVRVVK
jgi:hypothetical protein